MFAVSTLLLSVPWISVLCCNSTFCSHRSYFQVRTLLFILGRSWGILNRVLNASLYTTFIDSLHQLVLIYKICVQASRLSVSYAIGLSIGARSWSYKCGCKAVGHVFRVEEILDQVFMLMFQIYSITEIGDLPQISFQRFTVLIDVCSSPIV